MATRFLVHVGAACLLALLLASCQSELPAAPVGANGVAPPSVAPAEGPVQGWAVLAEKDDYVDVEMTSLPTDYVNLSRMRQVLEESGWATDHIRELREFDQETLQEALAWLARSTDSDDVALLYVGAHGKYLEDHVHWGDFFADAWSGIPSQRRLLVLDSCRAAWYTSAVSGDPRPHLSVAAVGRNEYGWWGVPEEGLPIIGGVFTYFFSAAFGYPTADSDSDGLVSVQEAAQAADERQRAYFHEVVFAVPEYLDMFSGLGHSPDSDPRYPRVEVDDAFGEPLFLALTAYR